MAFPSSSVKPASDLLACLLGQTQDNQECKLSRHTQPRPSSQLYVRLTGLWAQELAQHIGIMGRDARPGSGSPGQSRVQAASP